MSRPIFFICNYLNSSSFINTSYLISYTNKNTNNQFSVFNSGVSSIYVAIPENKILYVDFINDDHTLNVQLQLTFVQGLIKTECDKIGINYNPLNANGTVYYWKIIGY